MSDFFTGQVQSQIKHREKGFNVDVECTEPLEPSDRCTLFFLIFIQLCESLGVDPNAAIETAGQTDITVPHQAVN